MTVETKTYNFKTHGNSDIVDITGFVEDTVSTNKKMKSGIAVIFVAGSTAAISTIEYEPGLKKDIPQALEKIAPVNGKYEHHKTWNDDNGSAHVRSTLIGPSLTVPFTNKKLLLGTWQQICLLDFDTKPREREIIVQILG